ncbi:hypothetical protein [Nocardioides jensenii]|uniref:hypothetical protein n=1 Tax=Nocardioides jensenii TaxID=1843 RepID=UPI00082A8B91|nr:hypothetical protein [Nocardioides jensenii]
MPRQQIVYPIPDRPECEVLVDGGWWFGEVRMWTQDDDGSWSANVSWTRNTETRLDAVPAARVRPVENDYSRGRTGAP